MPKPKTPPTKARKLLRTERLAARVPAEVKEYLQHAADLSGRSLSDFVLASATAAAAEIIREREVIALTASESRRLAAALQNPPAPNARLQAAFEDYQSFIS